MKSSVAARLCGRREQATRAARIFGSSLTTIRSILLAGAVLPAGILLVAVHGCDLIAGRAKTPGDAFSTPGRMVRLVDGRRLNLRCAGAGTPTILLEGGFAADSRAWVKIQPVLAKAHRVCAYDRAGAGFSDPGPLPRDGAAIAGDLDGALRSAHIRSPFVVVGHSSGALYMRLFADRRSREVVGMVLVDPSVEHQDKRFAVAFGPNSASLDRIRERPSNCLLAAERGALPSADPALAACMPKAKPGKSAAVHAADVARAVRPDVWRAQVSELDNLWTTTSDELDAGRKSYGAMPLIVLTAEDTYAAAPAAARAPLLALWRALHREIAERSTRGEERLVTGSTHMMIFDRPEAIIAAVDEVISPAARHTVSKRPGGTDP